MHIHIAIYVVDIKKIILAFGLNLSLKFDEYSKSKPLASLDQSLGPLYDDIGYNEEDPTFIAYNRHYILGY